MLPSVPMTLAIVDDDDEVRRALHRLLRSLGHQVRVFTSAEDFEAEAVTVDCVIVDVRLPGITGLELRERLRNRTAPTPVVLITGDGERLPMDLSPGSDTPLVTKPFDDAVLTTAIIAAIAGATGVRDRHVP